jgi:hypothetical protein
MDRVWQGRDNPRSRPKVGTVIEVFGGFTPGPVVRLLRNGQHWSCASVGRLGDPIIVIMMISDSFREAETMVPFIRYDEFSRLPLTRSEFNRD